MTIGRNNRLLFLCTVGMLLNSVLTSNLFCIQQDSKAGARTKTSNKKTALNAKKVVGTDAKKKNPDATKTQERNQKTLNRLGQHLSDNFESINIIRATFTLNKPDKKEDLDRWLQQISHAYKISLDTCNDLTQNLPTEDLEVVVDQESNSVQALLRWKNNEYLSDGFLQITFGASDCCPCCYPECECPKRNANGKCGCSKPTPQPEAVITIDPVADENNDGSVAVDDKCACGKPKPKPLPAPTSPQPTP